MAGGGPAKNKLRGITVSNGKGCMGMWVWRGAGPGGGG